MIAVSLKMIVLSLILIGCASLQTQVQNDSSQSGLSGRKVFVRADAVFDGKDIDLPFKGSIKEKAILWLTSKGYTLVESSTEAHTIVWLTAYANQKSLYVPAQTYTRPIYEFKQPDVYTTTVKDETGQKLGTLETQRQSDLLTPSRYETEYVGAYNMDVLEEGLAMHVYKQEYGTVAQKVSSGVAAYNKYGESIFSSDARIESAVTKLLSKTPLSSPKFSTRQVASDKSPGCFTGIGLNYDYETGVITEVVPGSGSEKAGLLIGDSLRFVNGKVFDAWRRVLNTSYVQGTLIPVAVIRDSKEVKVSVRIGEVCKSI